MRAPAGAWHADREGRIGRASIALGRIEDPEIPGVTLADLGVIRHVTLEAGILEVGLTPTYTGCPATEVIRRLVDTALAGADVGSYRIKMLITPAWSSDWITPAGRQKLRECGIVPPDRAGSAPTGRDPKEPLACPRCHSTHTETISEFGSTPCKALHRCRDCLEPFEYFKCI